MIPIISIFRSIGNLIMRNLNFPKTYCAKTVKMEDGLTFQIFRHMRLKTRN